MPEPSWTYESETTASPTFGDRAIRLIAVVVGLALMGGIAFNVALIGFSPWLLLAIGLGFQYGIVATIGIVGSALGVLIVIGRRRWSTFRVAIATLPGWLIAAYLVRAFGTTWAVGAVDLVVATLIAIVAAAATGWVVANWDQQVSKT